MVSLFALFITVGGIALNLFIGLAKGKIPEADESGEGFEYVSPDTVQQWVVSFYTCLNGTVTKYRETVKSGNLGALVKPGAVVILLNSLGSMFSDFTLIWIVFFLTFTIPFAYSLKKDLVDEKLSLAKTQISQIGGLVLSKIPKYSDLKED